MPKIIATVLNITAQDIEACRFFYKEILNFVDVIEVKDENHHEILFHNPELSNNLMIKIRQNKKNNFIEPSADHLIVFYLDNEKLFQAIIAKLTNAGIKQVPSFNPYWDKVAKTFLTPSDYRIVLHPGNYHGYKARIARPTSDIKEIEKFYTTNLDFDKIGGFEAHEGFDGLMLSANDQDCHLEMTYKHGHEEKDNPTGYSIELITEPSNGKIQGFTDPDKYEISVNSQATFQNRYMSVIMSSPNIYQIPFWLKSNKNIPDTQLIVDKQLENNRGLT